MGIVMNGRVSHCGEDHVLQGKKNLLRKMLGIKLEDTGEQVPSPTQTHSVTLGKSFNSSAFTLSTKEPVALLK